MSSNIVATGEYTWTSSGIFDGNDGVDPGTNNANIDVVDFEEGSGDSEEDSNLTFENDNSRLIGGVNMTSSSNTRSSEKRKEKNAYKVRAKKKKTFGIGIQLRLGMNAYKVRAKKKKTSRIVIQLLLGMNQLLEIMLTRSGSRHMDLQGCSIPEVMGELHSIPGVSIDSDFHDFATEFLCSRSWREMWFSIVGLEKKLMWLKGMYARSKHG